MERDHIAGTVRATGPGRLGTRAELLGELLTWIRNTPAPMPSEPNKAYDPDAKPPARKRKKKAN